ncbi:MAG TPA: N-acetyltransferase, partial [Smithellaceae bacterium]|nr:N-acetyltransferase [Smithellaceae bacterium]
LSCLVERIAEFRIAVHPSLTGKGIGRRIAHATLETGFGKLLMDRIYLIVRKNNYPAMKLYESLGFKKIRESVHTIQGQSIEFFDMDITREDYFLTDIKETL